MSVPKVTDARHAAAAIALAVMLCLLSSTGASAAVVRVGHRVFGTFTLSPRSSSLGQADDDPGRLDDAPTEGTPNPGMDPPVFYNGGPVLSAVHIQVVYWDPSGYTYPQYYEGDFDSYLSDLAGASGLTGDVFGVAQQYVAPDGSGALSSVTNAPELSDGAGFPASGCPVASGYAVCLTDAQITQALGAFITSQNLPTSLSDSYIVMLPEAVEACFDSSGDECSGTYFCGYHSAVWPVSGQAVTYTVLPYPGPTCSLANGIYSGDVMGVETSEAHELVESATDPWPDTGYLDPDANEVADECAWDMGGVQILNGSPYNQLLSGQPYLLQQIWSDWGESCEQGLPAGMPTAAISATAQTVEQGTAVAYTVALAGDPSAVSSVTWEYSIDEDEPTTFATNGASTTVTLPGVGTFSVWATITDTARNVITAVTQTVVQPVPPVLNNNGGQRPEQKAPKAWFDWERGSNSRGGFVRARAFASAFNHGRVVRWHWTFGDGKSGNGRRIRHAYRHPGRYRIVLTITCADGATSRAHATVRI